MLLVTTSVAFAAGSTYTDNIVPNGVINTCSHGTAVYSATKNAPCLTDNVNVGYWMEGNIDKTTAQDTEAERQINVTMADYNRNTDLVTFYDSSPVFSGSAETDVVYSHRPQDFTDDNIIAFYYCDDVAGAPGSNKCDQGYINFSYINASPNQQRATACHESGHAFGLLHPTESNPKKLRNDKKYECLMNEPIPDYPGIGFDPNVANINAVYPN